MTGKKMKILNFILGNWFVIFIIWMLFGDAISGFFEWIHDSFQESREKKREHELQMLRALGKNTNDNKMEIKEYKSVASCRKVS